MGIDAGGRFEPGAGARRESPMLPEADAPQTRAIRGGEGIHIAIRSGDEDSMPHIVHDGASKEVVPEWSSHVPRDLALVLSNLAKPALCRVTRGATSCLSPATVTAGKEKMQRDSNHEQHGIQR